MDLTCWIIQFTVRNCGCLRINVINELFLNIFCFRYLIMKRLYLHMAPLEFTSIQIPSETVSGLLTLRVDAQKNCLNNVVISTLIAGSLS